MFRNCRRDVVSMKLKQHYYISVCVFWCKKITDVILLCYFSRW